MANENITEKIAMEMTNEEVTLTEDDRTQGPVENNREPEGTTPWEDNNVTTSDMEDYLEEQDDDKGSDTLTAKSPNYSVDNWGAILPEVQEGEEKMTSATSIITPYCECGNCSSAEEDNAKTEELRKKAADLKQSNVELVERARSLQHQLKHLVKVY